jgi:hypothetical protein
MNREIADQAISNCGAWVCIVPTADIGNHDNLGNTLEVTNVVGSGVRLSSGRDYRKGGEITETYRRDSNFGMDCDYSIRAINVLLLACQQRSRSISIYHHISTVHFFFAYGFVQDHGLIEMPDHLMRTAFGSILPPLHKQSVDVRKRLLDLNCVGPEHAETSPRYGYQDVSTVAYLHFAAEDGPIDEMKTVCGVPLERLDCARYVMRVLIERFVCVCFVALAHESHLHQICIRTLQHCCHRRRRRRGY